MPLLSIIVPVYNAEQYLSKCIESILDQRLKDFELVLVDDGSTDSSSEICNQFQERDKRVQVIHQKNAGQAAARNSGLKFSSGEYIAFSDNDDYLFPEFYELLLSLIEKYDADIAACNFQHSSNKDIDNHLFSDNNGEIKIYTPSTFVHNYFKPTWKIPVWNKLYKRELVENVWFSSLKLGEDNLFSYMVCTKANKIVYCDRPMYVQRMHGNNFELTGIRHLNELTEAKANILENVEQTFPEEYNELHRLLIYECIRVYNVFAEKPDVYSQNLKDAFSILRAQCIHLNEMNLPLRHLIMLKQIKLGLYKCGKKIVI